MNEKVDKKTANRILLAATVVFVFLFVVPFLVEAIGFEGSGGDIRLFLGLSVGAALIVDKIYLKVFVSR